MTQNPRMTREEARILLKEKKFAVGAWTIANYGMNDTLKFENHCPIMTLGNARGAENDPSKLGRALGHDPLYSRAIKIFTLWWDSRYPGQAQVLPVNDCELEVILDRLEQSGVIDE